MALSTRNAATVDRCQRNRTANARACMRESWNRVSKMVHASDASHCETATGWCARSHRGRTIDVARVVQRSHGVRQRGVPIVE